MGRSARYCISAATGIAFLAGWELLSRSGLYSPHLFPPPSQVLPALAEMARSGELMSDLQASGVRWGLGFFFGTVSGVIVGLITSRMVIARASVGPLLHFLRATPFIVLIPLAILWFGIGETEKVVLVTWGVFFPVWLNTLAGVDELEEEYVWAAQSLGIVRLRMYVEVVLPRALPFIVAGMRISIATGTFALAAAEMAGAFEGIAYRIFYSHQMFQTERMMAGIVVVGCLGFTLDRLFCWGAYRLMPWWERAVHAEQ